MTQFSLAPAYGVVNYHSVWGAHKMTIPTLEWTPPTPGNDFGSYIGHDEVTANEAEGMWTDLLTDISVFMLASSGFDQVTLYTKADEAAPSVPVAVIPLAIDGTATSTTQSKATLSTWVFRTTLIHQLKIVLLDAPVGSNFDKTNFADWGAEDLAILGALSDLTKAWAGRDGAPAQSGIAKTYTLSEALRRRYGMA